MACLPFRNCFRSDARAGVLRPSLAVGLLALVACGESSTPTAPTRAVGGDRLPNSVAGTWQGAVSGFAAAEHNGQLTVTLDELPYRADVRPLTGIWRFTSADRRERSGSLLGMSNGATAGIQLDVPPGGTDCAPLVFPFYQFAGAFHLQVTIAGNRLHGTVQAYHCTGVVYGTVELTR